MMPINLFFSPSMTIMSQMNMHLSPQSMITVRYCIFIFITSHKKLAESIFVTTAVSSHFCSTNSSQSPFNGISINLLNGFKKQPRPDVDFKNPYVDFWKYVQDAHNLTELVLSRRDSTPAVKSVLSLMKLMGLQKRLLTRDLTIKCFKSSAELMRALLITREGERDYCGLSDDTRDCEVTAFTGSIKVCLMILVLVNCREVKRGSRLV